MTCTFIILTVRIICTFLNDWISQNYGASRAKALFNKAELSMYENLKRVLLLVSIIAKKTSINLGGKLVMQYQDNAIGIKTIMKKRCLKFFGSEININTQIAIGK